MNRSLLKLVLVLMVVGALPFAASMWLVSDLLTRAVSVGLQEEVQQHLRRSADAHRQFIEAEKQAHDLAADLVVSDPRWAPLLAETTPDSQAVRDLLAAYAEVHPRLTGLAVVLSAEETAPPVEVRVVQESPDPSTTRKEVRHLERPDGPAELSLSFSLPSQYVEELELLGETLGGFRALETMQDDLTADMRRAYLMLAGGVAILAILLGTLLARRTTARIGRIADAANRVAAGDLEVTVEDRGRDELGDLADRFNVMVDELRSSHDRVTYLERVSAWQEIARRLAHEIKNPLTPILLAVQQLHETFDNLKNKPETFRPLLDDAMEIVREEVETLRALVKEFSDFARLPQAHVEPHEIGPFIEGFFRTNPQLSQRAEINLSIDPSVATIRVALDGGMMRRALVNLLDNAVDAASTGGSDAQVACQVRRAGDRVAIEIRDNGPGIPDDALPRLFEPYFTTKEHGTGLGLPIVKKIVLDHGGRISLGNRQAGGCRVELLLPVAS